MAPQHVTSFALAQRFQDLGAADFLVALRTQAGDDQFPLIVEDEESVTLLDQKRGRIVLRAIAGGGGVGRPKLLARVEFHAAEFATHVDTVQVTVFSKWCAERRDDTPILRSFPHKLAAGRSAASLSSIDFIL